MGKWGQLGSDFSGGSDVWDDENVGPILLEDYFAAVSGTGGGSFDVALTGTIAQPAASNDATASGMIDLTGATSALFGVTGTGGGSFQVELSAQIGGEALTATASGEMTLTGVCSVNISTSALASGSIDLTGASVSALAIAGAASGAFALTGSASALPALSATASGSVALNGNSSALHGVEGTGSGAFNVSLAALLGGTALTLSASGILALTGTAAIGSVRGVTFTATKVGVNEAPQSVEFVATATGIADQADAVIFWDFGDTYQFRYLPEDTKGSDRQSGTAIGHRAAHVYRAPGTYTVTCTAYQFTASGIVSVSTTQDVTIDAVDPAITSRVAISRNGDFTGAPAGATQQTWTGSEGNFTFNPNTAYYFQAGQTFTRGLNAASFTGGGVLKLHRYGTGANPILERGFTMWGSNHGNTTIAEVEFRGTFDVNQNPNWEDTGVYPTPPQAPQENGIFVINGNGGQTVLVYGVKVSGFQLNYYYQNTNATTTTHTVDCESTNWFNFGALSGNRGSEAWVGCHFHQKIGTQGLPDEIPQSSFPWNSPGALNTARSGPLRVSESNPVILNKSRFLSYRSGWSLTIQPGVGAIQPAVRVGTGTTVGNEQAVISQCDMIGGATVFSASIQNTATAQAAIERFIVENNYLAQGLDGETSEYFGFTKPGAHVRTNIFEYVAGISVAPTVGNQIRLIGVNGALSFGSNLTSYVYGNTLVVNGNTPGVNWQAVSQIGASSRPIVYENNVFQMNGTFDSAGSGALFQTNWNPLETGFPFAPQSGSAAFESYVSGRLPALSQDGTVRAAPFSLGASEEASLASGWVASGALGLSGASSATLTVTAAAVGTIALTGGATGISGTAGEAVAAGTFNLTGASSGRISISGLAAGQLPLSGFSAPAPDFVLPTFILTVERETREFVVVREIPTLGFTVERETREFVVIDEQTEFLVPAAQTTFVVEREAA